MLNAQIKPGVLASIFHFDLRLVLRALVDGDAEGAVRRAERVGREAGLGATDVEVAHLGEAEDVRRGVVIGYSLGWLKPYENLWLAYPPEVARNFPPELAELAGYAQHRPNLGNYEGQCPSILLGEEVANYPQATDALRPEQLAAVHEFAEARRSKR